MWRTHDYYTPFAPQTYTLRHPIRFEGTRQKQTDTKNLHKWEQKVKVQAEETHLIYDSLCERKLAEMYTTTGHGPKYIKAMIHWII